MTDITVEAHWNLHLVFRAVPAIPEGDALEDWVESNPLRTTLHSMDAATLRMDDHSYQMDPVEIMSWASGRVTAAVEWVRTFAPEAELLDVTLKAIIGPRLDHQRAELDRLVSHDLNQVVSALRGRKRSA